MRASSPPESFAAPKPASAPRRLRRSRPRQRYCILSFSWQILPLVGFHAKLADKDQYLPPRSATHVTTWRRNIAIVSDLKFAFRYRYGKGKHENSNGPISCRAKDWARIARHYDLSEPGGA